MWNELLHRQVIFFTMNRMKTLEGTAEQYERVGGNSMRISSQQHAIQGQMGAGGGWRVNTKRAHRASKYQVGSLQTAHAWANAGILLGGRMRRGVAFGTIDMSG